MHLLVSVNVGIYFPAYNWQHGVNLMRRGPEELNEGDNRCDILAAGMLTDKRQGRVT